jgi:hypothetical protein
MLGRLVACGACAAVVGFASDCVTGATPIVERCPTTTESVTFAAAGSCGPAGEIRISTMPGFCAINVASLCAADAGSCPNVLPTVGNFTGDGQMTNYDLTMGNWSLLGKSSDPSADPSTITCEATAAAAPAKAGSVTVTCNINSCVPSGEDNGFQCSQSNCVMHLSPPEPDAGAPDTGTVDSGTVDSGERDSGERDTGEHDSGERDTGGQDSGERDARAD